MVVQLGIEANGALSQTAVVHAESCDLMDMGHVLGGEVRIPKNVRTTITHPGVRLNVLPLPPQLSANLNNSASALCLKL